MKQILVVGMVFMATIMNAQEISYGVKAGVNLSSMSNDGADGVDSRVGFQFGMTMEYQLKEDIFLISGLEFSSKGFKENNYTEGGSENKTDASALYLQVPIHAGYKISIGESSKLVLQAGPYLAYGISGKWKQETFYRSQYTQAMDIDYNDEADFFGSGDKAIGANRFDFGLGAGAGIEFGKFGITLGYEWGLANVFGNDTFFYGIKAYNRNGYLSASYKL